MEKIDFEANRTLASFVTLGALIGCLFGSWIAFGVLCVASAEYIATMFCETWAARAK